MAFHMAFPSNNGKIMILDRSKILSTGWFLDLQVGLGFTQAIYRRTCPWRRPDSGVPYVGRALGLSEDASPIPAAVTSEQA